MRNFIGIQIVVRKNTMSRFMMNMLKIICPYFFERGSYAHIMFQ